MKKLLVIVVLGLLLSGNAYAEKPSVEEIDKNENYIILSIKHINSNKLRVNVAFTEEVLSKAKQHCESLDKKTYVVYEIRNENFIPDQISIHYISFWGNRYKHTLTRFFCANEVQEIFNLPIKKFSDKAEKAYDMLLEYAQKKKGATKDIEVFFNFAKQVDAVKELTIETYHDILHQFTLGDVYEKNILFKSSFDEKKRILRAKKFDTKEQQFNFVCKKQLNLKEGTKKFNDCVYKIMSMELELTKINAEKEIALAKAETAKANRLKAEEAAAIAIAEANSQKFKKNISNLIIGLLVLGEINQASQQANNFKKVFTCTPTGFASGLQYSVNCY